MSLNILMRRRLSLARAAVSKKLPYVTGMKTLSATANTFTITDIPFTGPVMSLVWHTNPTYYANRTVASISLSDTNGVLISTSAVTTANIIVYTRQDYDFGSVTNNNNFSYSGGTASIGGNSSSYKWDTGTYGYIVISLSETDAAGDGYLNYQSGTYTLTANANTLTIPHKLNSTKVAAWVYQNPPVYQQNRVTAFFGAYNTFSTIKITADDLIYLLRLLESRSTYTSDYTTYQVPRAAYTDAATNSISVYCRNNAYNYKAGAFSYTIISLEGLV